MVRARAQVAPDARALGDPRLTRRALLRVEHEARVQQLGRLRRVLLAQDPAQVPYRAKLAEDVRRGHRGAAHPHEDRPHAAAVGEEQPEDPVGREHAPRPVDVHHVRRVALGRVGVRSAHRPEGFRRRGRAPPPVGCRSTWTRRHRPCAPVTTASWARDVKTVTENPSVDCGIRNGRPAVRAVPSVAHQRYGRRSEWLDGPAA